MITHPDPQIAKILAAMEKQRDDALMAQVNAELERDALQKRCEGLQEAVQAASQFQADVLSGKVVKMSEAA